MATKKRTQEDYEGEPRTSVRTIRLDWFVKEKPDKQNEGWTDIFYGSPNNQDNKGHVVEKDDKEVFHRVPDTRQIITDTGEKRHP
jgi:hypothetical protein